MAAEEVEHRQIEKEKVSGLVNHRLAGVELRS
jgi:hypothetical protein